VIFGRFYLTRLKKYSKGEIQRKSKLIALILALSCEKYKPQQLYEPANERWQRLRSRGRGERAR